MLSFSSMLPQPSIDKLLCIFSKFPKGIFLVDALHLHAFTHTIGLQAHLSLGCCLLSMLVQAGSMCNAQRVFDRLLFRSKFSWNCIINGYINSEEYSMAFSFYRKMRADCIQPNASTYVALLRACAKLNDMTTGHALHVEVAKEGLLESNVYVGNALVDMYMKCGSLAKAKEVFDMLHFRDVVTWTALIVGYVQHGCGEEALNYYDKMRLDGVSPNAFTFACILKACGSVKALEKGREIHAEIEKMEWIRSNSYVCNALVDMYAKCGMLEKSREVFNNNPIRDVISWTALVTGYAEGGHGEEALHCFKKMQLEGFHPNVVTFSCILNACGSIKAITEGREIHAEIEKKGLLKSDLVLGTALVNMYVKCGSLEKAQEVFDRLPVRDVVTWTALIEGYTEHMYTEEALQNFNQMQIEGFLPDSVSLTCSLKACGSISAAEKGKILHAKIAGNRLWKTDPRLGNTLVDMYAKCGLLSKAHAVFDNIPVHDVVSWTALITGYAQQGRIEDVIWIFDRMRGEGNKPDAITYVTVLNACSHAGLVEKGKTYFEVMSKDYGIAPALKHHTCIIDLLGRAGQLDEVAAVAKNTPFHPSSVMWHTILGACRRWGNLTLGSHAFEQSMQLDEKAAASYVYMGNIYADTGMQEDGDSENVEYKM